MDFEDDMLNGLKRIAGIEAWINDHEMTNKFQEIVYPLIQRGEFNSTYKRQ